MVYMVVLEATAERIESSSLSVPTKDFNGVSVWDAKGTCNASLGDRYPIAPPNNVALDFW